ncbi:MAG: hypothetical protein R3C97_19315 [Geminicoccaceae bacterium]
MSSPTRPASIRMAATACAADATAGTDERAATGSGSMAALETS